MLKVDTSGETLAEVFNVTPEELTHLEDIVYELVLHQSSVGVGWFMRRLHIDEVLSEEAKVFATFMCGMFYMQQKINGKGGENRT